VSIQAGAFVEAAEGRRRGHHPDNGSEHTMNQYLLSVWHDADYDADFTDPAVQEQMARTGRFNEELQAAGAWVFANGLHNQSSATVVRAVDGDGTWNIRNGNTFLVSYTDTDIGLTLQNVGTETLHVDPQEVDGLAVIGGPWDLAPGETAYLHLVLCNATYIGGIPDFHDRDFHIHTDGWQGMLDFGLRFTLAPDQSALPC
jgi:hypothetical protein